MDAITYKLAILHIIAITEIFGCFNV